MNRADRSRHYNQPLDPHRIYTPETYANNPQADISSPFNPPNDRYSGTKKTATDSRNLASPSASIRKELASKGGKKLDVEVMAGGGLRASLVTKPSCCILLIRPPAHRVTNKRTRSIDIFSPAKNKTGEPRISRIGHIFEDAVQVLRPSRP